MGFRTIGRFIVITLEVMLVGICVSLLFYSNFGIRGSDFSQNQIVGLLLGMVPTNILSPC